MRSCCEEQQRGGISTATRRHGGSAAAWTAALLFGGSFLVAGSTPRCNAFTILETTPTSRSLLAAGSRRRPIASFLQAKDHHSDQSIFSDFETTAAPLHGFDWKQLQRAAAGVAASALLASSLFFAPSTALAENELSAKYGGGLDTSLVDQTCLVDHCSVTAKACLADDPNCRKGLTCTAKCLGDNACITGCMARYGNEHLDSLLKCTIEDHDCIKVAILPGGADVLGQEPRAPAPTVRNFDPATLEGSWYKVVGYNPNYDCYACQRNTFAAPSTTTTGNLKLPQVAMDVEFSMPHLLPDGSPPPPINVRELIRVDNDRTTVVSGSQSIALNDYHTRETMVFDQPSSSNSNALQRLVLNKGSQHEQSYARTAHSEGEMFGLST